MKTSKVKIGNIGLVLNAKGNVVKITELPLEKPDQLLFAIFYMRNGVYLMKKVRGESIEQAEENFFSWALKTFPKYSKESYYIVNICNEFEG